MLSYLEQTKTMITAAQDAGVPRIVLLSSAGARLLPLYGNPMPTALAAREQVLRESRLGVTYLRPSSFASNAFLPEQAHLMERLNETFRARRSVNITDDVENITGVAPGTFRGWCQRHADTFR
jgi:uncharacterized protein YbjT (DUF2867 family)